MNEWRHTCMHSDNSMVIAWLHQQQQATYVVIIIVVDLIKGKGTENETRYNMRVIFFRAGVSIPVCLLSKQQVSKKNAQVSIYQYEQVTRRHYMNVTGVSFSFFPQLPSPLLLLFYAFIKLIGMEHGSFYFLHYFPW